MKKREACFRLVVTVFALSAVCCAKTKTQDDRTLTWQPNAPGCSLEAAKIEYLDRYTIRQDSLEISLSVDARELTESQRRAGRVVGVLLSVRSRGAAPTLVKQSDASLEFIQHQHWKFSSWDPENLADHIQHQTDDLMMQTDKDLEHRPEKVEKNDERLRQHQKLVSEMLDFLSTKALKDTTLDPAAPEISGWIFFPSRGKWVGGWKKREEFVFRIPVGNWVVEFPFQLPPEGRRTLKERPE